MTTVARTQRTTRRSFAWRAGLWLAMALAGTAPGCDRPPDALVAPREAPTGRVLLLSPARPDPGWPFVARGAAHYFEQLHRISFQHADLSDGPVISYGVRVDECLQPPPDVVILPVTDHNIGRSVARRISRTGTPLITYGLAVDVPGVYGHVEVDWVSGVGALARRLPEFVAPHQSYLLIHEAGRSRLGTRRYDRFMGEARRQFGVRLLDETSLAPGASQRDAIRELIQRFKHAGLLVSLAPDYWWTASQRELAEVGRPLATVAAPPSLWPLLDRGQAVALVGVLDGQIGRAAAELALRTLAGSADAVEPPLIGSELITPETLPDFGRRYAEAVGYDPDAWRDLIPDTDPPRPR